MSSPATQTHIRQRSPTLTGVSAGCLCLLAALWLYQCTAGGAAWPAALLTHLPQLLFAVPALALLLLALRRRSWSAAALSAASVMFAAVVMAGYQWTDSLGGTPSGAQMRLMSYNIQAETMGTRGIVETIRAAEPDIVCLQEAGRYWEDQQPSEELMAGLRGYHVFRQGQILIASRYPIVHARARTLAHGPPTRPILEAHLDVNGRLIRVFNVHMLPFLLDRELRRRRFYVPSEVRTAVAERRAQVERLLSVAGRAGSPAIICGDFNEQAPGALYRRMASQWTDSFAVAGRGYGYTIDSRLPWKRIDFVFTRGLTARDAYTVRSRASDHRPLVAVVGLGK